MASEKEVTDFIMNSSAHELIDVMDKYEIYLADTLDQIGTDNDPNWDVFSTYDAVEWYLNEKLYNVK